MSPERRTASVHEDSAQRVAPARISVSGADLAPAHFVLERGSAFVGSDPANDLVIAHSTVSRRHAELQLRPGGVWIKDCQSTNGIRYQGARVREAMVPFGAALLLGKVELRISAATQDEVLARFGEWETRSAALAPVLELLLRAASSDATVLLEGETGTGKEVAARTLHRLSRRAAGPWEVVDCGAMSRELAGSELYGHVKGAFTGAERDRAGAFERAHGGTLFIDEVGELPADQQPFLLRAVEERSVRRVGAQRYQKVDVRLIAATSRHLDSEVEAGRFRADLLHRLAVVRARLPPLRERPEDLEALARRVLDGLGPRAAGVSLSPETLRSLKAYAWPGNIRELRNVIERAVAISPNAPIAPEPPSTGRPAAPEAKPAAALPRDYRAARKLVLDGFERDFIRHLVESCDGNVSRAAREAGLDRVYLHRLIKRHGL